MNSEYCNKGCILQLEKLLNYTRMKALVILVSVMLLSNTSFGQTNATDATVTDCEGATYNLFDELDAGKIIVIGWTMPCASCASPLLSVHNTVLNYAVSNPGVVEYWLTDDFANTNCSSIQSWSANAGITSAKFFSTAELDMYDYGSAGMPKVVVLGCTDHKVYYNVNNVPTGQGVNQAINAALNDMASGCLAGVGEVAESNISVSCYPNPASSTLNVSIETAASQAMTVEVVGLNGTVFNQVELENTNSVSNEIQLDINSLSSGMYFLKVTSNDAVTVEKFQVN